MEAIRLTLPAPSLKSWQKCYKPPELHVVRELLFEYLAAVAGWLQPTFPFSFNPGASVCFFLI
jgi:hypothetical protein